MRIGARRWRQRDEVLAITTSVNSEAVPLSFAERERLAREILDEIFGLGPLEPLLKDPTVSDILVNRYDRVYIERAGKLELTGLSFKDNGHLMQIIDRIVSRVGRRVDESSPMVDARLADGSRVNAIIPPLAIDGPSLSIRRFGRDPVTARNMIENKTLTEPMLELLSAMVKGRLNLLISGGTGAGKTTLLNVLSGYIPNSERIVTIEDAAELQMKQEHVVRLETRPPNIEGKGAVRQRQLVINSLRMRPDRIVVGEVRGEEAFDMLQAMNTGHEGSLTTVHANSQRDALARVENMVSMANLNIPERAVRHQITSAINAVVQIARLSDGTRRSVTISEIVGWTQKASECRIFSCSNVRVSTRVGRSVEFSRQRGCVRTLPSVWRRVDHDYALRFSNPRWRFNESMLAVIAILVFLVVALAAFAVFSLWDERNAKARLLRERLTTVEKSAERQPSPELAILRDEMLSEIPALDNILRRSERVSALQTMLEQANVKSRAGNFLMICFGVAAVTGIIVTIWSKSAVFGWIGMLLDSFPYSYASYLRNKRFRSSRNAFQRRSISRSRCRAGHVHTRKCRQ